MTEYRTRIIHVAMPRLGDDAIRRAAAAEAWREHTASFEAQVAEWARQREETQRVQREQTEKRDRAAKVAAERQDHAGGKVERTLEFPA